MTLWLFLAASHTCEFKYSHRLGAKSRGPDAWMKLFKVIPRGLSPLLLFLCPEYSIKALTPRHASLRLHVEVSFLCVCVRGGGVGGRCLTCLVGSYTWPLATETLQLQKKLYHFDATLLVCKPADRQELVYWRAK